MTAQRWRRAVGALVAGGLVLAGLALIGPARAAANTYAPSIGTATSNPRSGSTATAPVLITSKPCTAGTTAINAFVDSADAGLVGAVAIGSNTTDIANLNTTGISFGFNVLDVAAGQGKTLVNGRYEVSIVCLPDLFGSAGTGQFDAVFTVSGGATPTSAGTTYTFEAGGNVTSTTTSLATSVAGTAAVSARIGTAVTLTATVTPANAAGTVQFVDTPETGTPTDVGAPVRVAAGKAVLDTTFTTAGARTLTATFTPDAPTAANPTVFGPSSSAPVGFTVLSDTQAATTTTLATAPETFVVRGNPLTLTATVAVSVPAGETAPAPPAGTVDFLDGTTSLGTGTVGNGTATLALRPTVSGTLSLRAVFTPTDAVSFAGSASAAQPYLVSEPTSEGTVIGVMTVTSGNLEGLENRGTAALGVNLLATKPCPAGSTLMTVRIAGPGDWAAGFSLPVNGVFERQQAGGDITKVGTDPIASVASLNGVQIVAGEYLLAATCRVGLDNSPTGVFIGRIWFYDENNWLNQDPAVVGIPTDTTVAVTPSGETTLGSVATFTAGLTPRNAAGKVEITAESTDGVVSLGTVDVTNGTATVPYGKLPLGLYYVTATFRPTDPTGKTFNPSASKELIFAVVKSTPPIPTKAAALVGTAKVGSKVTCTSSFTGATRTTFVWLRSGAAISGAVAVSYRPTAADFGKSLQCRALASNAGGTVYRDSPAVRVTG